MGPRTARWLYGLAPFAFVLVGCGPDLEPLPETLHFSVLSATSSASAHSAYASFRTNVSPSCTSERTPESCVFISCDTADGSGEVAPAGTVTIQGEATVILDVDNAWTAEGDGSLFGNGDDVLFDVSGSGDVPALRATLTAPSSTSLSAPLPAAEGAPLELLAGQILELEWVPGNNGLMKFYAAAGLAGLACEWTVSDGYALLSAETLALLPVSDGTDSTVRFWTEQNDVRHEGSWEFLLLLAGEAAGATFSGYSKSE